jgi:hypothetical protein
MFVSIPTYKNPMQHLHDRTNENGSGFLDSGSKIFEMAQEDLRVVTDSRLLRCSRRSEHRKRNSHKLDNSCVEIMNSSYEIPIKLNGV